MNDFKLKMLLALLTGVVFSFIFILLAFVLPDDKVTGGSDTGGLKPKNKLQEVSQSIKNR